MQTSEQELNDKVKITENEYHKWQMARAELISHIRKPILYQYERIRKVKRQTTVVEINKYACSGCYAAIPPQKVMEVRHMDQLLLCESCGRILVCKNEKAVVES